jgi:hypothetical protein
MPRKAAPKRKETPAEQHKRFVEIAKKLEASEAPEDFDRAFRKVTAKPVPQQNKR